MYREDSERSVTLLSRLELSGLARLHGLHSRIVSYHGANVFLARRPGPRSALPISKSGRLSEIGICIIRNLMTATAALEKQIERYRSMTGEQRLAIALNLHELSCDIAREGIRHSHPEAEPAEVERLLRRRLELTRRSPVGRRAPFERGAEALANQRDQAQRHLNFKLIIRRRGSTQI